MEAVPTWIHWGSQDSVADMTLHQILTSELDCVKYSSEWTAYDMKPSPSLCEAIANNREAVSDKTLPQFDLD